MNQNVYELFGSCQKKMEGKKGEKKKKLEKGKNVIGGQIKNNQISGLPGLGRGYGKFSEKHQNRLKFMYLRTTHQNS